MNESMNATIEYLSQFVITDLTTVVIVIGAVCIGTIIILWFGGGFRTI